MVSLSNHWLPIHILMKPGQTKHHTQSLLLNLSIFYLRGGHSSRCIHHWQPLPITFLEKHCTQPVLACSCRNFALSAWIIELKERFLFPKSYDLAKITTPESSEPQRPRKLTILVILGTLR